MATKFRTILGILRSCLERSDPEFLEVLEAGLSSRDRDRWVAIVDALLNCDGKWLRPILGLLPDEPEAVCWLIAAGKLEFYQSGANPERSIARALRKIPELETHLERLEASADPWVRRMAREAGRIVT